MSKYIPKVYLYIVVTLLPLMLWQLLQTTSRTTRSVTTAREGPNYLFYSNELASSPDGALIDVIHKKWHGNYGLLEAHHGGMNWESSSLTKGEAKQIRESRECAVRVIRSYRLMLDFYGMELVSTETGEIKRGSNWKSRYQNLRVSSHNYLRISRIITSLGELGFARYKKPFVEHLRTEVQDGELKRCERSFNDFWVKLLDENSKWYITKTLEAPADREESVYFQKEDGSDDSDEMSTDDAT
ncbi:hypothetical protein PROFUN_07664 [Planoprotostelium fungivorum]|uniref:Opioid growth factor receptor (OGFr) conserved domain-containing protein n=1 Tax=Planoprotostelium fungivorum TaxID=1890364 RepID=A0A2P6MM31_9EUKA|nr:hypothetical protein PROFUN_07664 [Planoprotostelium fungivorum]